MGLGVADCAVVGFGFIVTFCCGYCGYLIFVDGVVHSGYCAWFGAVCGGHACYVVGLVLLDFTWFV